MHKSNLPSVHSARRQIPAIVVTAVMLAASLAGCGGACGGESKCVSQAAAAKDRPARVTPKKSALITARRGSVTDTYHGTKVADPYRWLENPDSKESRTWIDAQNAAFSGWLGKVGARKGIRHRLESLWNYERYGVPTQRNGRYFYLKNNGLQNQSVLYVADKLGAPGRVILDPNTLSKDGTVALKGAYFTKDGKHVAYQIAASGSDWTEIKVRDVATGKDLPDHIKWVKFSGASWRKDGSGFFYSRYDAPKRGEKLKGVNYFQKLYFHKIGTTQDQDKLIYERKDHKDWGFSGSVSDDDKWLIVSVWKGASSRNQVFLAALPSTSKKVKKSRRKKQKQKKKKKKKRANKTGPNVVRELLTGFEHEYRFIGSEGSRLWFRTNDGAERGRVIEVDAVHRLKKDWKTLIPEQKETLRSVRLVGDRFICHYLKDARSLVRMFDTKGQADAKSPILKLPAIGTAWGFSGDRKDTETFFAFTSFTFPTTIYRYDFKTGKATVFKQPKVDFKPAEYVTKQVFVPSKDGTKVPVFLVYKRNLKKDGKRPVYLHAYGGFNISLTPSFRVDRLQWVEMGGVYALANLRGGGEYGNAWHKAGMRGKKQNVFDDFSSVAKWLVKDGWTTPKRLAIGGGSNGGLLVGASITQHPELFGAALPAVGVMDMLRFHKWTIGWAWVPEYGSSDDKDAFAWLHAYSPYHNAKPAKYPATLVTTADHDDRVVPAHSFKFAAALQYAQKGPAPVFIRIETKAGHGAGKPTSKRIDEAADKWSFLVGVFGKQWFSLPQQPTPIPTPVNKTADNAPAKRSLPTK
ncbi:MAG: S9 family peptidase [Myxococcales bacterium]|nr:S9 family peptidase [Myxococcales bacterium]